MTATDLQLLHRYARKGSEDSFTALVNSHLDLVYSAALRQVRLPQLAQDVARSVFIELAGSADKLRPDTILPAWLYQVTRRRAIDVVRTESRRKLREQIAWEMNDMNQATSDWTQIEPLLDEAMESLDEAGRAAILLRYFENKSLREVGEAFGTTEEAARKRVSRAVDQLRDFFSRRKIAVGAAGLAAGISANAVQAAPLGLGAVISSAAILTPAAIPAVTAIAVTKAIAMTTIQKVAIDATITIIAGAGIYEARSATSLADQVHTLLEQHQHDSDLEEKFSQERDDARSALAALQSENAQLRARMSSLESDSQELAQMKTEDSDAAKDPTQRAMTAWLDRVDRLKRRLAQMPNASIPEMKLLNDDDWLSAASGNLDTDKDYARALSALRNAAADKVSYQMFPALQKYLKASGGQFPADLSQLQPYFSSPMDPDILQGWTIQPASQLPNMHFGGNWIITQKGVVDPENDSQVGIGASGYGVIGGGFSARTATVNALIPVAQPAVDAYKAANNGNEPANPSQLLPYATTPEQQAALQKLIQMQQTAGK